MNLLMNRYLIYIIIIPLVWLALISIVFGFCMSLSSEYVGFDSIAVISMLYMFVMNGMPSLVVFVLGLSLFEMFACNAAAGRLMVWRKWGFAFIVFLQGMSVFFCGWSLFNVSDAHTVGEYIDNIMLKPIDTIIIIIFCQGSLLAYWYFTKNVRDEIPESGD